MLRRLLQSILALSWVAAAAVSFFYVAVRSDTWPLPARASLLATSWTGESNAATLRANLADYARNERVTFAQTVANYQNRGSQRTLYVFAGDPTVPSDTWLSEGIGTFGGSVSDVVEPYQELGARSPVGLYIVFGDVDKAEGLQEFLASQGLRANAQRIGPLGEMPAEVRTASIVVGLLLVSLVGAFVVAGVRRYAVGRLHGLSFWSLAARDARRVTPAWMLGGVAVIAITTVAGVARYGTGGLPLFVATMLATESALLLAAATAYLVVLAAMTSVPMSGALKGDVPGRALTLLAYGLRVTSVALALGTVATTLTLTTQIAARDQARETFDQLGSLSVLTIGNVFGQDDQADADATVGQWLRSADQQGQVLIAAQESLETGVANGSSWRGTKALFVNSAFLERQPIRLTDGTTVTAPDATAITVIVPASHWQDRDNLPALLSLDSILLPGVGRPLRWRQAADNQDYFTYSPDGDVEQSFYNVNAASAFVQDPVFVVLPPSGAGLTDTSYASITSAGGLLAIDPQFVADATSADPRLARYVVSITPVAEKAAAILADNLRRLRLVTFAAVTGGLVVAATGLAAALVHTRKLAQRSFVRHIHGWSFVAMYPGLLAVELALVVGAAVWIPLRVLSQHRELARIAEAADVSRLPGPPPTVSMEQWIAVVAVAVLTGGGFLISLVAAHRRVMREGTSVA